MVTGKFNRFLYFVRLYTCLVRFEVYNHLFSAERASDGYVGRIVSGLPINSRSFDILPPSFGGTAEQLGPGGIVAQYVSLVFPNLPLNMRLAGRFFLASLVYHAQWMKDNMPANHPVFYSPLFAHPRLLSELTPLVVCRRGLPGEPGASGQSPHGFVLSEISLLNESLAASMEGLQHQLSTSMEALQRQLAEYQLQSQDHGAASSPSGPSPLLQVMLDQFSDIRRIMREQLLRLEGPIAARQELPALPEPADVNAEDVPGGEVDGGVEGENGQYPVYIWGGRQHLVPQGVEIPAVNVYAGWQLWVLGNPSMRLPPLRRLSGKDFADGNTRRRHSDLKRVMLEIHRELLRSGRWVANPTFEQASEMFWAAYHVLPDSETTELGKKRRVSSCKWRTMADRIRDRKRQRMIGEPHEPDHQ